MVHYEPYGEGQAKNTINEMKWPFCGINAVIAWLRSILSVKYKIKETPFITLKRLE